MYAGEDKLSCRMEAAVYVMDKQVVVLQTVVQEYPPVRKQKTAVRHLSMLA
jgi:hypothetical protein